MLLQYRKASYVISYNAKDQININGLFKEPLACGTQNILSNYLLKITHRSTVRFDFKLWTYILCIIMQNGNYC